MDWEFRGADGATRLDGAADRISVAAITPMVEGNLR